VATSVIGIDLSAQPTATACCIVEWHPASARIVHLGSGYANTALVELIREWHPTKVAIDSPFGWPLEFSRTITEFTESARWPDTDDRRPLLFRTTDLFVRDATGAEPLSVSSNLLAICAMRCARLLTLIADGEALDRTGSGLVAEVYPAAALRQWQLDPRGYKGAKPEKVEKRRELVHALATATASWLALEPTALEHLAASDHLFDALVAALVGRAVELGQTLPIPDGHHQAATAEGWIHLPLAQPLAQFAPFP
jgi:predicted nuclease with RNAse H fold